LERVRILANETGAVAPGEGERRQSTAHTVGDQRERYKLVLPEKATEGKANDL
jgi:hypothetical protein